MDKLTVVYDADCGDCQRARRWLAKQPAYVPLQFVTVDSESTARMLPGFTRSDLLRTLTVVDSEGGVYLNDKAWLMCLWALRDHRVRALRIASSLRRSEARAFMTCAAEAKR